METRGRSLSPQRLRPSDPIQDGDGCLGAALRQRGRFPRLRGPERRIFPDPRPPFIPVMAPVHVGRDGSSVHGALLRTVDRSPGLHESLCRCVSLGSLSRNPSPPVLGRLADPGLLGDQGQTARPKTALALSLPWDNDKRGEVRSCALTICRVPRDDHRHICCLGLPHLSAGGEIPCDSKTVLDAVRPSLPPGSSGGGSGHGITCPLAPEYLT